MLRKVYILDTVAPTSTSNSNEPQAMEKCFPYANKCFPHTNKSAKSVMDLITLYVSMNSNYIN